jgi:hypothetical protein
VEKSVPEAGEGVNMFDLGPTHMALPGRSVDASIAFYEKYARMQAVHR